MRLCELAAANTSYARFESGLVMGIRAIGYRRTDLPSY